MMNFPILPCYFRPATLSRLSKKKGWIIQSYFSTFAVWSASNSNTHLFLKERVLMVVNGIYRKAECNQTLLSKGMSLIWCNLTFPITQLIMTTPFHVQCCINTLCVMLCSFFKKHISLHHINHSDIMHVFH